MSVAIYYPVWMKVILNTPVDVRYAISQMAIVKRIGTTSSTGYLNIRTLEERGIVQTYRYRSSRKVWLTNKGLIIRKAIEIIQGNTHE